jgi:hypothetical protein
VTGAEHFGFWITATVASLPVGDGSDIVCPHTAILGGIHGNTAYGNRIGFLVDGGYSPTVSECGSIPVTTPLVISNTTVWRNFDRGISIVSANMVSDAVVLRPSVTSPRGLVWFGLVCAAFPCSCARGGQRCYEH